MSRSLIRGTQILAGSIAWSAMAAGAIVPTSSLVDGAKLVQSDGSVAMGAALNMGGFALQNLGTPVNANDASPKGYVDTAVSNAINGLNFQVADLLVLSNVASLSGLDAIDDVTPNAGDIVLLTAQTDATQNGLWAVASGAWTRPADYASAAVLKGVMYILVSEGTSGADTKYFGMATSGDSITVDTTETSWIQDTSGNQITAGNGLYKEGNQILANITGNHGITLDESDEIVFKAAGGGLLGISADGVGLTGGDVGQILLTNASDLPQWVTASGDATIDDTGAITVDHTAGSGFVKYTDMVSNETPTGAVDGTNTSFTLANANAYQLNLKLNGMTLEPGVGNDYTIAGDAITMLFAPVSGDKLRADYFK